MKELTVRVSGCKHWIDESMIGTCKEEGVSLEQLFFALICYLLYRHGLSEHKSCMVVKKKITQNFVMLELSRCNTG